MTQILRRVRSGVTYASMTLAGRLFFLGLSQGDKRAAAATVDVLLGGVPLRRASQRYGVPRTTLARQRDSGREAMRRAIRRREVRPIDLVGE